MWVAAPRQLVTHGGRGGGPKEPLHKDQCCQSGKTEGSNAPPARLITSYQGKNLTPTLHHLIDRVPPQRYLEWTRGGPN